DCERPLTAAVYEINKCRITRVTARLLERTPCERGLQKKGMNRMFTKRVSKCAPLGRWQLLSQIREIFVERVHRRMHVAGKKSGARFVKDGCGLVCHTCHLGTPRSCPDHCRSATGPARMGYIGSWPI